MKIVYIAHPLSGDWASNTASARRFAEAAARSGHAPMAPYLTLDGLLVEPAERDLGLAIDRAVIARCDEVWLCGPVMSTGMEMEAAWAREGGVPLWRWPNVDQPRSEVPPPSSPPWRPLMTDEVEAIRARRDRAWKTVHALCNGRLRWEMRVPAEPDHDPDLIISASLRDLDDVLARLAVAEARVAALRDLVGLQAEDEGLWFYAQTAPEAYLQQELRRLHAAIEAEPPEAGS